MRGDPGTEAAGAVGEAQFERGGEVLRWTVHPLKEGGARRLIALASVALFAIAAYLSTGSATWGVFAALILFLSLTRYFLPTDYILTVAGVEARFPLRTVSRPWSDFSSIRVERNGIFLSPYKAPKRRENYRGLFLLTGRSREEVISFVRARVEGGPA